jgi:hypothetical protein
MQFTGEVALNWHESTDVVRMTPVRLELAAVTGYSAVVATAYVAVLSRSSQTSFPNVLFSIASVSARSRLKLLLRLTPLWVRKGETG